jgi:hypothetical protein
MKLWFELGQMLALEDWVKTPNQHMGRRCTESWRVRCCLVVLLGLLNQHMALLQVMAVGSLLQLLLLLNLGSVQEVRRRHHQLQQELLQPREPISRGC